MQLICYTQDMRNIEQFVAAQGTCSLGSAKASLLKNEKAKGS